MEKTIKEELEDLPVTFKAAGMSYKTFKEIDEFCKQYFNNNRAGMISALVNDAKGDYKYHALYDKILEVESKVDKFTLSVQDEKPKELKTFGE